MFVAINYITAEPKYVERFEELFKSRAGAIDAMPGFRSVQILKPQANEEPYLVVSHWDSEENFKDWTQSEAFHAGHQRAFADLKAARERGENPPMHSKFLTYTVLAN